MELYVLIGVAILLFIIGTSMLKGNIQWLHSYHRKRIEEKDYPIVGRLCGIGLYCIAIGTAFGGILMFNGYETLSSFIILPFLAIGIILNLYAVIKYNKGLF